MERKGLSQIEVIGALLISAFVVIAALNTVGSSMQSVSRVDQLSSAIQLAEVRLSEAVQYPYEDPDGNTIGIGREIDESGTNRITTYDDVDDYDGLVTADPTSMGGGPEPGYYGWTLRWDVDYVELDTDGSGQLVPTATDTGLKRLTVTVTDRDGVETRLVALKSRQGPNEGPSPFHEERVPYFRVLATPSGGGAIQMPAVLLNDAPRPK